MRPSPTPPVPGVVLLQRVAACCRREHQHSEVGRDLRPDLKARLGRKRGAFRTPRPLPVFSTRRRREWYKNTKAAGQSVWVGSNGWGCAPPAAIPGGSAESTCTVRLDE